jgi:hypothetical protein
MHTMHFLPGVAIQPNLELKTPPKQLLGSLPLVIALPGVPHSVSQSACVIIILIDRNLREKIYNYQDILAFSYNIFDRE